MGAGSGTGPDAAPVSNHVSGESVSGRLGPGRSRPTLGIFVAALLVAALVAWPNLTGTPEPSPTAASSLVTGLPDGTSMSPTTSPSGGPLPSPAASGPFVEQTIIDRPGVPAALYDKYWAAGGQVGQVGTTARLVMPPGEGILGFDAGRVASYRFDEITDEPLVGPNGVTVTVRDIRTGTTLWTLESSIVPSYGLAAGSHLFWTGYGIPYDPFNPLDGGVWVVDLDDPDSTPRAIIPASDLAKTYGPSAERGRLRLTDRGRAITTLIGGDTAMATQVIDVASLALRSKVADEFALQVAGGLALVLRPDRLLLLDLATTRTVGPGVETDLAKYEVVGNSEVFVQFGRNGSDSYISAIALDTGEARDIRVRLGGTETLDLSPQLSTPDLLVLLSRDDPTYDPQGRVQLPVSLLDPATGDLQLDAFTIGDP